MKKGAIIGYGLVGLTVTLYGAGFFRARKQGFTSNKFFATIYGVPVKEGEEGDEEEAAPTAKPKATSPRPKATSTKPKIEFKKDDIVLAKNDTTLYTAPPRNVGERPKYKMARPKKGANIGWYMGDHKKVFGTFYSKVRIRLKGGAYKTVYMPKRDIKVK